MLQPQGLKAKDLLCRNFVKVAASAAPQRANDLSRGHRHELLLLQELGQNASSEELMLCCSIEVRAELGKGSHLAVLGQLELQRSGNLLHCLDLCCTR